MTDAPETPHESEGRKPLTDQEVADRAMSGLEGLADSWAAEVCLPSMLSNALSPFDLNKDAPIDVRASFKKRMTEQVDAIVRQAFIEGAYTGRISANDAKEATIATLTRSLREAEAKCEVLVAQLKKDNEIYREGELGPAGCKICSRGVPFLNFKHLDTCPLYLPASTIKSAAGAK